MLKDHHQEVTIFDGLDLEVDSDSYEKMEKAGLLKVFTAREGEALAGYASFFLFKHSHHRNSIHANQDTVYVRPEKRGVGSEFLSFCDEELKKIGVSHVHRGLPINSPFGAKLEQAGYEAKETVYIRRLQ